jgi:hypothetical protein
MINTSAIRGTLVRSSDGRFGRVSKFSTAWITVEWNEGTRWEKQSFRRTANEVHEDLEVFTTEGWKKMALLLGKKKNDYSLDDLIETVRAKLLELSESDDDEDEDDEDDEDDEELEECVKEALFRNWSGVTESLNEEETHHPFKRKKRLGPGPRGGENDETKQWKCVCNDYDCACYPQGNNKRKAFTFKINRAWKKRYNAEYRAWRKKQGA